MSQPYQKDARTFRQIGGVEYEWRYGPSGLGWYNEAKLWFLTAEEADVKDAAAPRTIYSTPPTTAIAPENVNKALMWAIYMLWPVALVKRETGDRFVRFHARQALALQFWKWPLALLAGLVGAVTGGVTILAWLAYYLIKAGKFLFIAPSRACQGELFEVPGLAPQAAPKTALGTFITHIPGECPNGHGSPVTGGGFCPVCGARLVVAGPHDL